MPTFPPTTEQTDIVNAVQTGETVVVKAGAGSGKTSTLVLVAEALSAKNIAYMAFNRDIASEATRKFPSNVEAKTIHGFAYRGTIVFPKSAWGQRFDSKTAARTGYDYARALGITAPLTLEGDKPHVLKSSTLGYIVRQTVERFCQSGDDTITRYHVPLIDGLDKSQQDKLGFIILPLAEKVWTDLNDESARTFAYSHDHYRKQFQLAGTRIKVKLGQGKAVPAEVILFDEAQDAPPVVLAIVKNQEQHGCQIIAVGDENQAIYGFTGARNALDAFNVKASHVLKLTKSFRFGQAIADVANLLLAQLETDMRIVGHDPVPSEVVV